MSKPRRKEQPALRRVFDAESRESLEFALGEMDHIWVHLLWLSELMPQHSSQEDALSFSYFLGIASRDIEEWVKYARECLKGGGGLKDLREGLREALKGGAE